MTHWKDGTRRNLQSMKLWAYFQHYWDDIDRALEKQGLWLQWSLFDNCREQGYTLRASKEEFGFYNAVEVSFTESRNSDSIRLYPFNWENALNQKDNHDYDTLTESFNPSDPDFLYNAFLRVLEILGIQWG